MNLKIFLFIIISNLVVSINAQDLIVKPDFQKKFQHLNTKDGLSHNRILDVFQDRYGFIWIATINGLNRYDGYNFLVFKHSEEDSTSLSSNLVTSIAEDIYGNLWIGSEFGLNKFDRKNNVFRHFFDEDGLKNNHIRALFADEMGSLWIETVDGHLHHMDIRTERFESYKHTVTTQAYYHYHSIFKQNDSSIWVGGRNQDVQRFNTKTKKFTYYNYSNSYEYGKRVNDVSHYFEDSKGQMWVCGLDGAYQFDPITGEFDLFLSGSTFYIFEDDRKNLWFGTGNGIYIYDREQNILNHIQSDVNNPHSLSNRNVNKIIQDRSGVVWIATNSGLNLYRPKLHQFSHYYHIPENHFSISGRTVTALLEDESNLWIGTNEDGINQLDLRIGKINHYNNTSKPSLISNRISDLLMDQNKKLWVGHWSGKGIEYLNTKTEKVKIFQIDEKSTNIDWYHQIIEGKNNDLLLAVWGGYGLYRLDLEKEKLNKLGKDLWVVPNESDFNLIHCENDSIWWLGGEKGSIWFYVPGQKGYFQAKNLFPDKSPGFQDLKKMKKYNYINVNIPDFKSIKNIFTKNDTSYFLCEKYILFYDYAAKKFGSIDDKERKNNIIKESALAEEDFRGLKKTDTIVDFYKLRDLSYFITKKELYQINHKSHAVQKISLIFEPKIDFSEVQYTAISLTGSYIILASNRGIITINRNNLIARHIRSRDRQFMIYPVHLLTSISEGNKNDYWLGSTGTGIARWYTEANKIVNYNSDEFDPNAFWGWDVSFIYKDSKNRIWSGGKGLHLYNEDIDGFIHYTTKDGLPSNHIFGITEDASGRLWITTDNGLSCFHMEEETFINYDDAIGLPEKEMTDAIITLSDNRIAAGLANGFILFHPDSLIANHYIPPVILTHFQIINGDTYDDLTEIDTIILQPDENHIAFSFSCLDYNSPQNNRYKYRLNGLDEEWMETDAKSRWINYSNLDPGYYMLQLRGSNNNDIWNNNGKSLYIYVKPHFYEQWWFYLLIGLFIVFAIVMIVIYRIREINLKSKSVQMEQRFLRSQMNPHFIFNSLGAIQNYIFKNEPLEAATYLSDFSNLVRMILNNSRKDLIPLDEEVTTLKQYLELQKLRFNNKFEYELEVDEQLSDSEYEIPPMLAQPFIENSIEHAFNGMKEKGLIKICFELENEHIKLICRDNGMGINAAINMKKHQSKKHQSLATQITHDRIRVLSKVYKSKINLNIQDLNDIDSSEKGTQVIIEIPFELKKK